MRIFAAILGLALILLQYRFWISDQGIHDVRRLQAAIAIQAAANREQADRNRQLAAEVRDLKVGMAALEERGRSELGMVRGNETFYQVVTRATPAAPAPAAQVSARAQ